MTWPKESTLEQYLREKRQAAEYFDIIFPQPWVKLIQILQLLLNTIYLSARSSDVRSRAAVTAQPLSHVVTAPMWHAHTQQCHEHYEYVLHRGYTIVLELVKDDHLLKSILSHILSRHAHTEQYLQHCNTFKRSEYCCVEEWSRLAVLVVSDRSASCKPVFIFSDSTSAKKRGGWNLEYLTGQVALLCNSRVLDTSRHSTTNCASASAELLAIFSNRKGTLGWFSFKHNTFNHELLKLLHQQVERESPIIISQKTWEIKLMLNSMCLKYQWPKTIGLTREWKIKT